MANSKQWATVDELEEIKALLVAIEQERRLIKTHAYYGSDFTEIYKATNRQRAALEKLETLIHKPYKKALKQARE